MEEHLIFTSQEKPKAPERNVPAKETPLMAQYNRIKAKHPDALLLFRVGDFYETFGQDAITASRVLGIVLTKRSNGAASEVELAGFPHHALDTYLPKLVKSGLRVAICDQLEDPKTAKTVVKRGVTEVITPGVTLNEKLLDHRRNNYLAAVEAMPAKYGLSLLDASTGEFLAGEGGWEDIRRWLTSYGPAELLIPKRLEKTIQQQLGSAFYTYPLDDWVFTPSFAREKLTQHFQTTSLKGFGVEEMTAAVAAAGAVLHYMSETEHGNCSYITTLRPIASDGHMRLDGFTMNNLELTEAAQPGGTSLLGVLDKTVSPMGARLMRHWLTFPLTQKEAIESRLDAVGHFYGDEAVRELFLRQIKQMGDLERLVSRITVRKAGPRDLMQVKRSLEALDPLIRHTTNINVTHLRELGSRLSPCVEVIQRMATTLTSDPPVQLGLGDAIAKGVSDELDELRELKLHSKEKLAELQTREARKTGIHSLKVGFNSVFGYYLEVTHAHKAKVPNEWIRKQTLTNAERYVTEELKQYEEKILGAEERMAQLEARLFEELLEYVSGYSEILQRNAHILAEMDCLLAFGSVAVRHNYTRPVILENPGVRITEGRHPVIERQLPYGEVYVPNDLELDPDQQQVLVITGPNMSGKSAYLRQAALITVMAQAGCYVPASSATIGIVDHLFSRVGASDNISCGESTFMVEMIETACILNNLTGRSLVLMDEIGRGTSTYDGISIAWAIAEHLHNHQGRPLTLFATHYHELTDLADKLQRVRNFHVSTREAGKKVIFLRKVVPGGSMHSFGIHVAGMAGVPKSVVERADVILRQLEEKHLASFAGRLFQEMPKTVQMSIFESDSSQTREVIEQLKEVDLNGLTPIEALMRLSEWQRKLR